MDKATAALLLENLLDRVELDASSGKWRLGTISTKEKIALEVALAALGASMGAPQDDEVSDTPPGLVKPPVSELPPPTDVQPEKEAEAPPLPSVTLDTRSLERTAAESAGITLCLDFGTAMSKAFAMHGDDSPIELALGVRAGAAGYPVDSSLFIRAGSIIKCNTLVRCCDGNELRTTEC